jgi:DNA repair photolyase
MRWQGQELGVADASALPGMEQLNGLVRSVTTPEFAGVTFHEVLCKSALNHVPSASAMPFDWTVNPYRGCSHACVYCFARGTHEYLELDAGRDFDTQVVVKVNVADVLEKELRRGSWQREPVMLGTNTDPYQRAEGRYKLMPGIVSALTESGTPFSILTKGTLLRRDLPMLKDAATDVHVTLAMSIAVFDDELQHLIEPGTPNATARLDTVRAATEAGFRVTVFLMPIIPHLTDSIAAIDHALTRIKEAGAVRVVYGALHLRPGAKQWFLQWLAERHPELVSSYRGLYPGATTTAPKAYRAWLAKRVRPLLRVHGLDGRAEDESPRGAPVAGLAQRADARSASIITTSRGRAAAVRATPVRGAAVAEASGRLF